MNAEDSYGVADKYLSPEARRVFEEVGAFRDRYSSVLPPGALAAIDRFLSSARSLMTGSDVTKLVGLKARLAPLAAFRAELAYHLSDRTAHAHRLSERAFRHLQRTIVADPMTARSWADAFEKGEPACEKLGAAHLLAHGLWPFKASGAGEATDLVFAEPVDTAAAEASAEALVITEWKLVCALNDMVSQARQAHAQAARYARGVLGGLELVAYRYLGLFSLEFIPTLPDFSDAGVRYRHVNIAISPGAPSRA